MTVATRSDTSEREAQFVRQALPLRAELERAARRYTRNFHDAEDLVAETYAKAWAGYATFREGTNFRAWIHRILVHNWIDAHRRSESRPPETLTDSFSETKFGAEALRHGSAPSAEDCTLRPIPSDDVLAAMRALTAAQQMMVFYADVCELRHREIAAMTGIPIGTVMSRVFRARRRLSAELRHRAG